MQIPIGTIWIDGVNVYRTISDAVAGKYRSEYLEEIEDAEPHLFPEYESLEIEADAQGIIGYSKFYGGSFPAKIPVVCRLEGETFNI